MKILGKNRIIGIECTLSLLYKNILVLSIILLIKLEQYSLKCEQFTTKCETIQKPWLREVIVNRSTILNMKLHDFIDLHVGTELLLECEGRIINNNGVESINKKHKQLEWILPEFHPLYDDQLPEHVEIREIILKNSSGIFVRSTLKLSDIQTTDVGHYSCLYKHHISLISDENQLKLFPSLYVFVSGKSFLNSFS